MIEPDGDVTAASREPAIPADMRDKRLVRPDGRTVAWVETGVLNGRPILRLPGLPGSRLTLRDDETPWVARGLRVINTGLAPGRIQ